MAALSRSDVASALAHDRTFGYGRVRRVVEALLGDAVERQPSTPAAVHLRALLRECASRDVSSGPFAVTVPDALAERYVPPAARIAELTRTAPDAFFSLDNDAFLKDLATCLGEMLPGGARLVDLRSGLPRRLVLQQRWGTLPALGFLIGAGGFKPWFETHVDPRDVSEFHESGLVDMYLRVAQLLDVNPQVLGVFGASWFYDPCVEPLSPHLAYLRRLPCAHGGRLFRGADNRSAIGSALAKSARRRQAYEQGRYRPQTYFLVWPRRPMLQWARSRRGASQLQTT